MATLNLERYNPHSIHSLDPQEEMKIEDSSLRTSQVFSSRNAHPQMSLDAQTREYQALNTTTPNALFFRKYCTLIVFDPHAPEKCVKKVFSVFNLKNTALERPTLFDLIINNWELDTPNPHYPKTEILEDGTIKFNLNAILTDPLSSFIANCPSILEAYQQYRYGQPITSSFSPQETEFLMFFSDCVDELGFGASIPESLLFMMQSAQIVKYREYLFYQVVVGPAALDFTSNIYPLLEIVITNPFLWIEEPSPAGKSILIEQAKNLHPSAMTAVHAILHHDVVNLAITTEGLNELIKKLPKECHEHILHTALKANAGMLDKETLKTFRENHTSEKSLSLFSESVAYTSFINEERIDDLEKGAKRGSFAAMSILAEFYLRKADEENKKREHSLLESSIKKAASNPALTLSSSYLFVTNSLAWLYLSVKAREQDPLLALSWYESAAKKGHLESMFELALLYLEGNDIAQNCDLGLYWLSSAASKGMINSLNLLGLIFMHAFYGIDFNPEKAIPYFEKAAKEKDPFAICHLHVCHATIRAPCSSEVTQLFSAILEKDMREYLLTIAEYVVAKQIEEQVLITAFDLYGNRFPDKRNDLMSFSGISKAPFQPKLLYFINWLDGIFKTTQEKRAKEIVRRLQE